MRILEAIKDIKTYDIIEIDCIPELRIICNDECELIIEEDRKVIHPNEDYEFELEHVTKVWREQENGDYKLIYSLGEDNGKEIFSK